MQGVLMTYQGTKLVSVQGNSARALKGMLNLSPPWSYKLLEKVQPFIAKAGETIKYKSFEAI